MTWDTYRTFFSRVFPSTADVRIARDGGIEVELQCTKGHTVVEPYGTRLPADKVMSHLRQKGWLFRGKKTTCPEHARKEEKPMAMERMERVTSIDVPAATPKTVTVDARKAKREAMTWLDQSFNVEKGRYDEGVSDKTIATETGMAEQAVAAMREEFYGPLKEPAEVALFRQRVTDVQAALDNLETEAKQTFAAMRAQVNKLVGDFAEMVKKNRW